MESKSKEVKKPKRTCVLRAELERKIEKLEHLYNRYKVRHDRLLGENSDLRKEVADLKYNKYKCERCEKYHKVLLHSISKGSHKVVMPCNCASEKVDLQKMVSMLEEEKRDIELSKNNEIEGLKIKFNDMDEELLKYRMLLEEQLKEIKNLEGKIKKTEALFTNSNERIRQIQSEKTKVFQNYKEILLEKDCEINEKNFKINELEGKIKFLNDKNNNILALIIHLYEEVRNLKGKTSLANIEAQFRKTDSESQSKIIELENEVTDVNEKFEQRNTSSDQQRNEINSLKLVEQNILKEKLKLLHELLEMNKKLSKSNLQCSTLSDKQCTEIESMKKTIKDLNFDKHCHLNETTRLKSALVEMKHKCAQYKASADTKDTEGNQLQEQINIKDTEVNQLQEQISIMQLKTTQSLERVAEKRPLEQSDTLAVTCATKKVKSLQSSEAFVSSVDNTEIVTPADATTNLVGHEEDLLDSNLSCDIISLLNSDEHRQLTFSSDLVMPINDCASTQTDNSIVKNASERTYNCDVRNASTHTENFIVANVSFQTDTKADDTNVLSQRSNMSKSVTLKESSNFQRLHKKAEPHERKVSESKDSQLLPPEQLPCSSETTMQTCVIGLFEDLPDENEYFKTLELHESKVTMNLEEEPEEFSFHQSYIVDKPIQKYERKVMKGKSKVSQQEHAKETCEALNFLLNRKELTVSKVTGQKCVNYSVPSTINSITKHELESTLTAVSHVSDIQNDNVNASDNKKFQTKESATISEVPATHDRS